MAKTNKNKWKYDPNDITILNAALDGLAGRLELEGTDDADSSGKVVRSAINVIYELSNQQIHLATAIEILKKKLDNERKN